MEKKIITSAAFEALHDADIVFTKYDFTRNINLILTNHKIELHEKSIHELIKQLLAKDYIEQKDEHIIKTEKSIIHEASKQRKLFQLLVEELCKEFDVDYIKSVYTKSLQLEESMPADYYDLIGKSFDYLVDHLSANKKICQKNNLQQIEITK